jgi:hypothetical protein
MLIDLLINQSSSPYYLSTEIEVLYRKMLKRPFPSNNEWNEMLRLKIIPTKLHHEMIIQIEKDKETIKVNLDIANTSHQTQRGAEHKYHQENVALGHPWVLGKLFYLYHHLVSKRQNY